MRTHNLGTACFVLLGFLAIQTVFATTYKWVDDKGITHYGDQIPPEYQKKGGAELNKRGVVVKQTDPELNEEQRKAKEQEMAKKKIESQHATESARQDAALLNTYTSPEEIDEKRDRDLQYIKLTISNTKTSLANADSELKSQQDHAASYTKNKKPVPQHVTDEIRKASDEQRRLQDLLLQQNQQLEDIKAKYAAYRKRFIELNGEKPGSRSTAR